MSNASTSTSGSGCSRHRRVPSGNVVGIVKAVPWIGPLDWLMLTLQTMDVAVWRRLGSLLRTCLLVHRNTLTLPVEISRATRKPVPRSCHSFSMRMVACIHEVAIGDDMARPPSDSRMASATSNCAVGGMALQRAVLGLVKGLVVGGITFALTRRATARSGAARC